MPEENLDVLAELRTSYTLANTKDISDWIDGQSTNIVPQLLETFSVWEKECATYQFLIEKNPNPVLRRIDFSTYPSLQTYYVSKFLNAIFCPMFKQLKNRLIQILRRLQIFADVSPDESARKLTNVFPPCPLNGLAALEKNISISHKVSYLFSSVKYIDSWGFQITG